MNKARKFFCWYCVVIAIVAASVLAARAVNLKFSHFEDGSGKVSWCLPNPLGDCSQ